MLPIIMLSGRGEEVLRLRGFGAGADDFVVKPFSMRELIARVRALLRRSRFAIERHVLTRGDLQLDHQTRRVRRGLRDVHLRPTEFRLLECLLERPGGVFSRQHLLERVWGPSVDITDRAVDVQIGRLRKALSSGRERDPILRACAGPAIPSMRLSANPNRAARFGSTPPCQAICRGIARGRNRSWAVFKWPPGVAPRPERRELRQSAQSQEKVSVSSKGSTETETVSKIPSRLRQSQAFHATPCRTARDLSLWGVLTRRRGKAEIDATAWVCSNPPRKLHDGDTCSACTASTALRTTSRSRSRPSSCFPESRLSSASFRHASPVCRSRRRAR